MKLKTLIIFLIFIISTINAYSITDDFVAVANDYQIDVCICGVAENIIKIGNTGTINNIYSLTQTEKAEEWSILSEKMFSLDSGKVKEIVNIINIPCDTKKGEYELKTYVSSALGLKKILNQIVNVKECVIRVKINNTEKEVVNETPKEEVPKETPKEEIIEGITISIPVREDEICGCEKTIYNVILRSEKNENITIGMSGPEWAKLGWTEKIELDKNGEFSFDLIAEPSCEEKGKQEIQLIAKNSEGKMVDKTSLVLDVTPQNKCNKLNIITDEILINRSEVKAQIEIKNIGEKKGEYDIIIEGEEWAETKTTITLEAEESKNISLDINLDETIEDGTYNLIINAKKGNYTIQSKNVELIIGEKQFDFKSFLTSLLVVLIIVGLIVAAIVIIYRRKNEEVEEIQIEEEKPKKTSKKVSASKKKRK